MLDLLNRDTIFSSLPRGVVGAEVGVDYGGHANDILLLAEPRLLYLIDCWCEQSVDVYGHDPANQGRGAAYHHCLSLHATDERVKIIKAYSLDAAKVFPDEYFDFLYLDANHLKAHEDCCAWWPKMKHGSFLMGHDYVRGGVGDFITVAEDVDRFVAERGLTLHVTVDADTNYKNFVIPVP